MAFEKHLLVDGANVLHAWPELKALLPRDRQTAREKLAQVLFSIHDSEQIRVTLVHDGRGAELTREQPSQQATFSVIHTPTGVTADEVIEQIVANSSVPANCVVASADRAIQQTVETLGATWVSPVDLLAWVERAAEKQTRQATQLRRATDAKWRRNE
jgi:predicted RNA-binding protein with PIN domain